MGKDQMKKIMINIIKFIKKIIILKILKYNKLWLKQFNKNIYYISVLFLIVPIFFMNIICKNYLYQYKYLLILVTFYYSKYFSLKEDFLLMKIYHQNLLYLL